MTERTKGQSKPIAAIYARVSTSEQAENYSKAREGFIPSGRPPYGYMLSEGGKNKKATLVIKEDEAEVVRLIFHLYAHEGLSLRGTSRKLRELGVKAPCGREWDNRTLRDILSRETYVGTYHFRKRMATEPKRPTRKPRKARKTSRTTRPREEGIPISVPPIVEREVFDMAQKRLSENRARLSGRRDRHCGTPGAGFWQRNCYEHLIRNPRGAERVRDYIRNNPARWQVDRENPDRTGDDEFDLWLDSLSERRHVGFVRGQPLNKGQED